MIVQMNNKHSKNAATLVVHANAVHHNCNVELFQEQLNSAKSFEKFWGSKLVFWGNKMCPLPASVIMNEFHTTQLHRKKDNVRRAWQPNRYVMIVIRSTQCVMSAYVMLPLLAAHETPFFRYMHLHLDFNYYLIWWQLQMRYHRFWEMQREGNKEVGNINWTGIAI